jgi:hypothetical protein
MSVGEFLRGHFYDPGVTVPAQAFPQACNPAHSAFGTHHFVATAGISDAQVVSGPT